MEALYKLLDKFEKIAPHLRHELVLIAFIFLLFVGYVIVSGEQAIKRGMLLAEQMRDQLPKLRIMTHCGDGSFKSQFKKADKSGAQLALVLGEDELEQNQLTVKFLRKDEPQLFIKWPELSDFLSTTLSIQKIPVK